MPYSVRSVVFEDRKVYILIPSLALPWKTLGEIFYLSIASSFWGYPVSLRITKNAYPEYG